MDSSQSHGRGSRYIEFDILNRRRYAAKNHSIAYATFSPIFFQALLVIMYLFKVSNAHRERRGDLQENIFSFVYISVWVIFNLLNIEHSLYGLQELHIRSSSLFEAEEADGVFLD